MGGDIAGSLCYKSFDSIVVARSNASQVAMKGCFVPGLERKVSLRTCMRVLASILSPPDKRDAVNMHTSIYTCPCAPM